MKKYGKLFRCILNNFNWKKYQDQIYCTNWYIIIVYYSASDESNTFKPREQFNVSEIKNVFDELNTMTS